MLFYAVYVCVRVCAGSCAFVQCVYVLLRGQTQLSEPHGQILQPPSPQTQPSTSLPWLVRAEDSALVPSLHWLPRSLPSGRISQSCPSSGSGSPGCSGQTLGWLVSADAASAAAAAAAGARRLQAAANVADGGQGGRKETGPILRPLAGGDKTKGLSEQARQLGRGPWAQLGLWAHIGLTMAV